ncbi:hypothetical protein AC579_5462 [Pseudocercospora musae]|uniref:Uncharacterized protein n=1 Tax=Pseudocercospora musae TaxID=113226 RepID=A0A139IQ79_9PEZI|nr:hypothetical protein AC579_5462 [Pseudocercospora musae]
MADTAPIPTKYEHRGDMTTSGFVPTAPVTQHITNLVPGTKYSVRSSATYKYTEDDTKDNIIFVPDDQRTACIETSNSCPASTEDCTDPSQLSAGTVIYDRATGAQLPETWNDTSPVATVVTVTSLSSAGAQKSSNNITTVAAGIAVPLGVLLSAALAGCAIFWKQLQEAKGGQAAVAEAQAVVEKPHDEMYYGAASPNAE